MRARARSLGEQGISEEAERGEELPGESEGEGRNTGRERGGRGGGGGGRRAAAAGGRKGEDG